MNPHRLERLRPKIVAIDRISTVPAVLLPLTSLLRKPPEQVSIEKVVELASYDGMIAARFIRMANSPLFGRRNTETVRSAILTLGLKRVEAILVGCCLNSIVPPDEWIFDALTFWRHSLGCALVSSKMAKLIGYPEPEKAYLAGLLHDLGILVNTLTCPVEFAECIQIARESHVPLNIVEEEHLGFTHCQSGKLLAENWKFSEDVIAAIESHHEALNQPSAPLASLVHLSDLLCRLRDLGYGYYEAMGVELSGDANWKILVDHYPALADIDLARLSMDIEGAMDEIVSTVNAVYGRQSQTSH